MAKIKEQNSIEQLIEEAQIPHDKVPYKVPDNWVWTRLECVCDIITGSTPKKAVQENYGGDFPFVKPNDLEQGRHLVDSVEKLSLLGKASCRIVRRGSSLLCCIGSIGKSAFAERDVATNQQINALAPKISELYLYYFINSKQFVEELWDKSSATTISIVNKTKTEQVLIPLAPLEEQQRIVERIESLFFKLDEAKEKIKDALDSYSDRRARILHSAFTGELTKQWREQSKISFDTWKEKKLEECCDVSSGGTPSRKNLAFFTGNIPWIKTGEINWNLINDSEEKVTEEALKNSSAKMVKKGAVLLAMYGQGLTRGRAAILNINATTNQAVCILQPYKQLNNVFLFYYFMANYWELRKEAVGGNQPNYSGAIIKNFRLHLPPMPEQVEIVRILDSLLEKEDKSKELLSLLDQIDEMKKSILARAFRGKLATQSPTDQPAIELLKEIIDSKLLKEKNK